MDVGHLLKIDPASTGATARRLSRGKSPLKGRGARGGAGAVEPGLTLHLIPLRGSSKAAGLWYRNRVRKRTLNAQCNSATTQFEHVHSLK
ncbi:hypothetical protein T4E_2035 [Trichinella pseudospiralis]|uniref:Uncharacterized protein n=4 Tax=Trichinella pseudospiralis TaxID=6337 RepID=A0A0V0YI09_TRIPS|nr:hypothetical protein T4E_2035 [Trichinella pseudospiralis]